MKTSSVEVEMVEIDKVLFWAIDFEGVLAAFTGFEGSTVTIEKRGEVTEFSLSGIDQDRGTAKLQVRRQGEEAVLEELDLVVESSTRLSCRSNVEIKCGYIKKLATPMLRPVGRLGVTGSCCVTCGDTTACNCGVSMTCGSCCSGDCCPEKGDLKLFFDSLARTK